MKQSELQISIRVKSYDEKTVENYRNCYIAEKCIVSNLSKKLISNFNNTNLKTCLSEVFIKISRLYILHFSRNKQPESVTVGPRRVGPDRAGPGQAGPVHSFQ